MRPTFLLNNDQQPVSCIAPKTQPHELRVGDRLKFAEEYETPWGYIPRGSCGFVEAVSEEDGMVTLFMEGSIPALWEWQHRLVLVPFLTDDVLPNLRLSARVNAPAIVARLVTSSV